MTLRKCCQCRNAMPGVWLHNGLSASEHLDVHCMQCLIVYAGHSVDDLDRIAEAASLELPF